MSETSVIERPLGDILSDKYLAYALSTIMSRSLPDVRDGLKPVHRRLLFAMTQLKLSPDTPPKKSARVVGDVIGKFHPHGDTAVYDALVRLAQDFSVRYPLVDGQGNFGNIDGDSAAAMRYTEARLTAVARAMLEGLDSDSVDFRNTYDGDGREPEVLPGAFPNLLANGASGIAVGMATSIPPHNVGEIADALQYLIHHPDADVSDLLPLVPGPDFPTGGILIEGKAGIEEAYRTGRGSFRLRAHWEKENLKQGLYQIIVTEVPYQVQKSRLVERIAELITSRKIPNLDDVRDESAEDVRLVLMPKSRNVDADVLMEQLFRFSDLEVRFSLNMNVLDMGRMPKVMNLKEVLAAFLDHRHAVLIRRSKHRLGQIRHRLEILDGFILVYLHLDEVIRIVRESDEPKATLMTTFGLTETQAEAVLNMRLRSLRKLEEIEIRKEHKALSTEGKGIEKLLADQGLRWNRIDKEIGIMRETFVDDRRTRINGDEPQIVIPVEAMVEREPVTVLVTDKGWVRAVGGHIAGTDDIKVKEGDRHRFALHAETTDKILVFATNGRFYTLRADHLPRGRGFGEPLRIMIDLGNDADVVVLLVYKEGEKLLMASDDGRGFIVAADEVLAATRAGKQILNVSGVAEARICKPVTGDHVAVLGDNRKLSCFPVIEIPQMTRGRGVILQKYRSGGLADLIFFNIETGLQWKRGDQTRTETAIESWLGHRAAAGRLPPVGFPRVNRFG